MSRLLELSRTGPLRIIGLMSGTSADGVDAAVCRFEAGERGLSWRLEGTAVLPFTADERNRIHAAKDARTGEVSALHFWLGKRFADAARAAAEAAGLTLADCDAIGSHGQTVFHGTDADPGRRHTLQLGCPAVIAERTGLPVVSDFRSRDIAAGGEGAPLMPYVDALLFGVPGQVRWLLNLGGMANVTIIPGDGRPPLGWDTGPGNALIDAAVTIGTGGAHTHDSNGSLASRGVVDEAVLETLLAHPFLALPPPKSTGREVFGQDLADSVVRAFGREQLADAVATLTRFTAASVADSLKHYAEVTYGKAFECFVSGGGVHNPVLMSELRRCLAPVRLSTTDEVGMPSDFKEAVGFALLAYQSLRGVSNSCPSVTGARHSAVLGSITL